MQTIDMEMRDKGDRLWLSQVKDTDHRPNTLYVTMYQREKRCTDPMRTICVDSSCGLICFSKCIESIFFYSLCVALHCVSLIL